MRMDENSNPEWKKLLRGISSGRKALEIIAGLEEQLAECQQTIERARTYTGFEAYACPLCEYKEGKFVKYCQPHRQLAECESALNEWVAEYPKALEQLTECQRERDALVVTLCDRWINCADELPKRSGRYLTILSSGIANEIHGITIEYFEATKTLNKFHTHRHTTVTHWMDLPPMPNEQQLAATKEVQR